SARHSVAWTTRSFSSCEFWLSDSASRWEQSLTASETSSEVTSGLSSCISPFGTHRAFRGGTFRNSRLWQLASFLLWRSAGSPCYSRGSRIDRSSCGSTICRSSHAGPDEDLSEGMELVLSLPQLR